MLRKFFLVYSQKKKILLGVVPLWKWEYIGLTSTMLTLTLVRFIYLSVSFLRKKGLGCWTREISKWV